MAGPVFHAERIFDGHVWHENAALVTGAGHVAAILPRHEAPAGTRIDGWIVPGLVDLQVNGGGGVLFNNAPHREGIATICAAHARFGTTATLVTLISDTPEITATAIAAAGDAGDVRGFLGLHLEGPHLSLARKGTHDPALIRPMEESDLAMLSGAARRLANLVCTLAPESARPEQVRALSEAGAVVSLGHSDCDHAGAQPYVLAGARMVTHLFNAMSQLGHRNPGLVGTALDSGALSAGLIADGFHVDDAAMRIALRAKAGPGQIFLVSDAMSTIGTDLPGLTLNGRQIYRREGRLTLADGTLAGADIALIDGMRYCHQNLDQPLDEALRMAGLYPARAMGLASDGHLRPGARADFFSLTPELTAGATWIGGQLL